MTAAQIRALIAEAIAKDYRAYMAGAITQDDYRERLRYLMQWARLQHEVRRSDEREMR